MSFEFLFKDDFFGNSLAEWGVAFVLTIVVLTALRLLQAFGLSKFRTIALKLRLDSARLVLDPLQETKFIVLLLISLYIGSQTLTLPASAEKILYTAATIAFFLQLGLWSMSFIAAWIARYRERKIKDNPAAVTTMGAVSVILRMLVWVVVVLLILDNLGFNVTALVAGLGIGGVAVALAVQNILGDLFASLTIVIDRPFVVGDFLILDDYMGTVEYIGLNSTRLRSLAGEEIILSNSDLIKSRVRNYGRMYERRVVVKLGVTYKTSRDKLEKIPQIIRTAIEAHEKTRFDRAHFMAYAQSGLDFEYVYYVTDPNYNLYMDINQAINLTIHEQFEKEGIDFALPVQTLFIDQGNIQVSRADSKAA